MAITIEIHISTSLLALMLALLLAAAFWQASSAKQRQAGPSAAKTTGSAEHGRASAERVEEPSVSAQPPEWISAERVEEPSVSAEAPEWIVVSDKIHDKRVYYFTSKGERVHTSLECWGLRSARRILSSDAPEVLGKTRCKLCFLHE